MKIDMMENEHSNLVITYDIGKEVDTTTLSIYMFGNNGLRLVNEVKGDNALWLHNHLLGKN